MSAADYDALDELRDDAPAPSITSGTILDGKYEVLSFLGSGGMGSIFKARHIELGNLAAIKVMHGRFAANPESVRRFQNEARFIANLRHKNILTVYSFGSINALVYMAMEFVEGQSLSDRIFDHGPLTPEKALPIFLQVCEAMSYAHKMEVLHRDLKPANVMMVEETDGIFCAKVVDFGLAKLLDGGEGQRLTHTGEVVGDPHYMSPEQAQGKKLDARSDIYSFGCLMYEVLSGEKPFTAESPVAVLYKQISEHPQPFAQSRQLPPALEAITFTCMAKDADQRYESFAALASVLTAFLQNPKLKVSTPALKGRSGKRQLMLATAGLAALAILAALALTYFDQNQPDNQDNSAGTEYGEAIGSEQSATTVLPYRPHYSEAEARHLLERSKDLHDPILIANAQLELSRVLGANGSFDQALSIAQEALKTPGLSEAKRTDLRLVIAEIYMRTGKGQKSIPFWEQILVCAPAKYQRDQAAHALITLYLNNHKFDDAEKVIKTLDLSWLTRDRRLNPNYLYEIALVCHRGRSQEAERLKEKLLAAPIDDLSKTEVLYCFVISFSEGGDLGRALDCLQEMRGLVRASRHPKAEQMDIQRQIAEMALLYHTKRDDQVIWNGKLVLDQLRAQKVPNTKQLQEAGQIYATSLRRQGKVAESQAILEELQTKYRL